MELSIIRCVVPNVKVRTSRRILPNRLLGIINAGIVDIISEVERPRKKKTNKFI